MTTLIEGMIPQPYLLQLAIYIQTCAHIEREAWAIVQIVEGFDPTDDLQTERFLQIKLGTWKLINAFEEAAKKRDGEISRRMLALVERIKMGVENRNFAAHAAIFWDRKRNALFSEHYFLRKIEGKPAWHHTVGEALSDENIHYAISDADNILREAASIRLALQQEQSANDDV